MYYSACLNKRWLLEVVTVVAGAVAAVGKAGSGNSVDYFCNFLKV